MSASRFQIDDMVVKLGDAADGVHQKVGRKARRSRKGGRIRKGGRSRKVRRSRKGGRSRKARRSRKVRRSRKARRKSKKRKQNAGTDFTLPNARRNLTGTLAAARALESLDSPAHRRVFVLLHRHLQDFEAAPRLPRDDNQRQQDDDLLTEARAFLYRPPRSSGEHSWDSDDDEDEDERECGHDCGFTGSEAEVERHEMQGDCLTADGEYD